MPANPPSTGDGTLFVRDIQYTPSGQIASIIYGNDVVTTYTYDTNLRTDTMVTVDPSENEIQNLNYDYYPDGNISQIYDAVNTSRTQVFTYDDLGRLVSADGLYGYKTYVYNELGNIEQKDGTTYTYFNGTDGAGPHAVKYFGATQFQYDGNGNMTAQIGGGIYSFSYDARNRLEQYQKVGQNAVSFLYDETGSRTRKQQGSVITRFVGSVYENGTPGTKSWIYAGSRRVASVTAAGVKYYHPDHLGGTNAVTNEAGVVADQAEYKPFGEFASGPTGGSTEGRYYTGQYHDSQSDLYYYGARYYNPVIGRFITPDTIVQSPAHSQSLNRYSYVWNNPINAIDPSGNTAQLYEANAALQRLPGNPASFAWGVAQGTVSGFYHAVKAVALPWQTGLAVGNFAFDLTNDFSRTVASVAGAMAEKLSTAEGHGEAVGNVLGGLLFAEGVAEITGRAGATLEQPTGFKSIASEPVGTKTSPMEVTPGTNPSTQIYGRQYSGHAIDRMQGRGVFPSVVENTIKEGVSYPSVKYQGAIIYYEQSNNISVVTNTSTGRVITVGYGKYR